MTRRELVGLAFAASAQAVSVKDIQNALKLSFAGDAARRLAAQVIEQKQPTLIDGRQVAFVFESAKPVFLTGAIARHKKLPMQRLSGTSLHAVVLEVERNQKVPYRFETAGGAHDGVLTMPDYRVPKEASPDQSIQGTGKSIGSDIWVHVPKKMGTEPLPLTLVLDGAMYREARLPEIVDSLTAARSVPPQLLAFSAADADPKVVLETVSKEFRVGGTCVAGALDAGFRAFETVWRNPEVFGRLLVQSGRFPERGYADEIRSSAVKPIRGYLSVGRNDPEEILDANHLLWGALRHKGYPTVLAEDDGFASIYSWQKQLPAALAQVWKDWRA